MPFNQYMPPIPPCGIWGASGLGISATMLSVVRKTEATEAAFSSAERVTFVGSMMPLATMSVYSVVRPPFISSSLPMS